MVSATNLSKKTSTSKSTKTLKNTNAVKSTKVIKSTKTLKSSNDDSSSLTICSENNFDDSKREEQNPPVKKVKFNGWKHEIFSYKYDAIKYIEDKKDPELKLFCEDMGKNSGCKEYCATTYDNMYCRSKDKSRFYYENYESNQKVKLVIDIDKKMKKKDEISHSEFDDLLKVISQTINKKIKEYTNVIPKIIIIKACRDDKMSAHIIYTNIHFESIKHMKFFMMDINSKYIADKTIDMTIYRPGCMRLLWNSKMGKSTPLEYKESDCMFLRTNKYEYVSDYKLFMDCLLTNISDNSEEIKIDINVPGIEDKPNEKKGTQVKGKKVKGKQIKLKGKQGETDEKEKANETIEIEVIKKYLDILDIKRASQYNEWLYVGMCLYNSNNSKESFLLWDEWSKKAEDSYDDQASLRKKWLSFNPNSPRKLHFGTLKYYARTDNPEACRLINYTNKFADNKPDYKTIAIEKSYLLEKTGEKSYEKIKDQKTTVTKNMYKWIESDDIKTLSIKSPYNTGKTSLITQLIDEYEDKFERISFVTHRQSLTNELHGTFGNYGFCSYMSDIYDSDRIICQIESLHKLRPEEDPLSFDEVEMIVSYDLVILDEVESLLYHYESSTVKQKQPNFALMMNIIKNSKKVLALDGDFHNRAYYFLCNFGESLIIHNTILKDKKNFMFTNDLVNFDKSIDENLEAKKNIVIVTMSANIATKYNKKYEEKYKTLTHCGFSDDKMKELLKDVEKNWLKDLIIYSPSVQAGVSFDKPHFHKMYVVLSSKSCSPRDLNQMCHRVRQFECNDVEVYLNGMPFKEEVDFFTFDDAKERVKLIHNKYSVKYKDVENHETDPYMKTLIYNELENLNKAPYYFVPMFIKLIKEKGSTYSFDKTEKSRNGKSKGMDFNKESVKNAEDIDIYTYSEYLKKQMRNEATSEMKFAIEKYLYKKHWKIDILTDDFLDKWFRKTYVLHNLRVTGGLDIKGNEWDDDKNEEYFLTIDTETNKKYLNYDRAKHKERIECVINLIDTLGFTMDIVGKDNMLTKEEYDANRLKVYKEAKIFKDKKLDLLFDIKVGQIKTNKSFMGFANNLLQHYGLCIKLNRKTVRTKGTKKRVNLNSYYLDFLQDIKKYV